MLKAESAGRVALPELSGLCPSLRHPGVLFGHNDSGDSARFFAISEKDARILAEFTIPGATAVDWEAISTGRATDGTPVVHCADVGSFRQDVLIWQVEEPAEIAPGTHKLKIRKRIPVHYPDGRHDCEAIVTDPRPAGRTLLIEKLMKASGKCGVYSIPYAGGTAKNIGGQRQWITDAAVHPDGKRMILRAGDKATMLTWPAMGGAVNFDLPHQVQGEAMCFSADGRVLYLGTEGASQQLLRVNTADLPKPAA